MLKKIGIFSVVALLAACSSGLDKQFPNAKYKISDKEMKTFILKMNNAEQCIHPELKGLTFEQAKTQVYDKYTELEHFVWQMGVSPQMLEETIGAEKVKYLASDDESFNYFAEKQRLFNNQDANIDPVECEKFKVSFFDALERLMHLQRQSQ